jgi:DNA topoisomerase-3
VVIATDADREGETIAREVLDYFNYKGSTRRLWLSALDTVSVQRALNAIKPSVETEPLYYSGLARGRADWLIGMNLTRAFTLLANDRQVRSVGRVQTPTLALIVKRDREISNFKAVSYYEVMAYFKTNNGIEGELLETKWQLPEQDSKGLGDEQKQCLDKQVAQAVIERCQQQMGLVTTATTTRKKQPPPLLYNLSGLQQEASRRWGYGAQDVLNLAQALYETHKLTSYPRSDCEYLPLSQFNDVDRVLQALCKNDASLNELIAQADKTQRSRVWNDKKITAHHAIIPTQATPGIARLNDKELNIYNLIRRRYIAQFFPDYEYDQSTIIVTIKPDQFKASGRIARVKGWKIALEAETTQAAKAQASSKISVDDNKQELPAVKKGEQLLCDHLKLLDKLTKPPRHYTEGTLIKAMETIGTQVTDKVMKKILRETAGLGTQATRANIIQTLFQRKFIHQEKKLLKATTLGFNLIDAVPDTIKDPLLTAQWEQQLDDIANNKGQDLNGFLKQQIELLKAIITQVKTPKTNTKPVNRITNASTGSSTQYKAGDPCPECSNTLETRSAVRGKKIGQDYIGCSNFPDCRFYFWP